MAKPFRLLSAALLGAVTLLAACSSDPERDRRDGPISFKRFDAADTNHDGKLDREEIKALPEIARYFDRIDTDHSGYISWTEMRAARFPVFREPRYLQQNE